MSYPKITYLDKAPGIGVPKEQNIITPANINEIKFVVNSLSDGLNNLPEAVGKSVFYVETFPETGVNEALYISAEGQAKLYYDNKWIDCSIRIVTSFDNPADINDENTATTQAISAFVDSKLAGLHEYTPGYNIEISEDYKISQVRQNIEISGMNIICHRTLE